MISKELNALKTENFNSEYFDLHLHLFENGDFVKSRNGDTRELLNFKTIVTDPTKRCIGGYNRNVNIFFLLAEAMWIFSGRRDVAFLDIFNSKMKNYSDDGKYFNAPYGWRLRNFGVDSFANITEENNHYYQGEDQLRTALCLLDKNPEDRRVVCQIWNTDFDLGISTVDTPCNDMLMFKIRNNKLYQTIQNRSNDLNWGLTTNIFQFSFIGEIMSKILGIELGDQVHNSQSLHIYLKEPLTNSLQENINRDNKCEKVLLYDVVKPLEIDFKNIKELSADQKLIKIDFIIKGVITTLMDQFNNKEEKDFTEFDNELKSTSIYFTIVSKLLKIYVNYKQKKITRLEAINLILVLGKAYNCLNTDIIALGLNFFVIRINEGKDNANEVLEMLSCLHSYSDNGLFYEDTLGTF